jgi:hypothetical protein
MKKLFKGVTFFARKVKFLSLLVKRVNPIGPG